MQPVDLAAVERWSGGGAFSFFFFSARRAAVVAHDDGTNTGAAARRGAGTTLRTVCPMTARCSTAPRASAPQNPPPSLHLHQHSMRGAYREPRCPLACGVEATEAHAGRRCPAPRRRPPKQRVSFVCSTRSRSHVSCKPVQQPCTSCLPAATPPPRASTPGACTARGKQKATLGRYPDLGASPPPPQNNPRTHPSPPKNTPPTCTCPWRLLRLPSARCPALHTSPSPLRAPGRRRD